MLNSRAPRVRAILVARALIIASIVLCARQSRGAPIDNLLGSDAVNIDFFNVQGSVEIFNPSLQAGNACIPKDVGSLDLVVPASALGISGATNLFHLTGSAGPGEIVWTLDETVDPPIPLTLGSPPLAITFHVIRVTGTFVGSLETLQAPSDRACGASSTPRPFTAHLESVTGASQLTFYFSDFGGFSSSTTNIGFTGVVGPVAPGSTDIQALSGPRSLCVSTHGRDLSGWVGLTGQAPGDGVSVELSTTAGLFAPSSVFIGPQLMGTIIPLTIDANATGDLVLTATTATSAQSLTVAVASGPACEPPKYSCLPVTLALPVGPPPCVACGSRLVGIDGDGDLIEAVEGEAAFVRSGKAEALPLAKGITSATPVGFNAEGEIIGTWQNALGQTQSFIGSPAWNLASVELLPRGVPAAISDAAGVVGRFENAFGEPRAFLSQFGDFSEVTVGPGFSSATGINNAGIVIGNRVGRDGFGGFISWGGQTVGSGDLGGGLSEVLAIDDLGNAVGTALTRSRHWHATLVRPVGLLAAGTPAEVKALEGHVDTQDLGTLAGFSDSYATHIDRNGHIVGVAFGGKGGSRTAFLYTPELGTVNLAPLISGPCGGVGFEIDSVVALNDSGAIAVRGREGPSAPLQTFLLVP
jgi:uncharacterized membrane protein